MILATAAADGTPSARVVLLRGVDERGFTWYTNRTSLKGRDLEANPTAALVFHWERLERQVRVSGSVSVIPDDESAAYFAGRPRRSQLAAWASPQGQPLDSRVELVSATEHFAILYPDTVPLPPFWGGYRLRPSHDRVLAGSPQPHARPLHVPARRERWVVWPSVADRSPRAVIPGPRIATWRCARSPRCGTHTLDREGTAGRRAGWPSLRDREAATPRPGEPQRS